MINPFKDWLRSFRQLMAVRYFRLTAAGSFLLLLATTFLPIWRLFPIGLRERIAVPLHYNIYSGIDLFGPWWQIFLIPTIGLVILLLNSILAVVIWPRETVLSYFYLGVCAGCQVILFIAMVFVVMLNLSYG